MPLTGDTALRRRRPCRPEGRRPGLHGRRRRGEDLCRGPRHDGRGLPCRGQAAGEQGKLAGVADEGGYWPAFDTNEEALGLAVAAIEAAGFTPGDGMAISLDIAASDFGKGGRYKLAREGRDSTPTA